MENTNRSIQGRTDETEIEETVATTLEIPGTYNEIPIVKLRFV